MQWFIMTPITLVQSVCALAILSLFNILDPELRDEMLNMGGGTGIIMFPIIIGLMISICLFLAKLLVRIKGKNPEYTYYDKNYEYEIYNDYSDHLAVRKTKGGWTTVTKGFVWFYVIFSPIIFILQLISNFFAFISLFSKRISSWYGIINYDSFDHPLIQKVLHFLFNIVILPKGYKLV